jgi:predicted tellurium resistance membrane protein TerC
MTLAGVELVENFKPVLLFFAAILVYSSYGILTGGQEEEDEEDLENNGIVKVIPCLPFISLLRSHGHLAASLA